jgi:glycosyltransferase involved in cell wall biosynthesis
MVDSGVPSRMRVASRTVDDATVTSGSDLKFRVANRLEHELWRLQRTPVKTWRSPARFGSLSATDINRSGADVVNLHWVTDGFLSVDEIGKITKPIVWSLYDMWPFAGTEHYGADKPDARWRSGYTKDNRPVDEGGIDLDRLTWQAKRKHWLTPMQIVPASTWLQDRAGASELMRSWPITRIAHVIDCDSFAPMDPTDARRALNLPVDRPLILFLASAGIRDDRKGFDLLEEALPIVRESHPDVAVVAVGPKEDGYTSPSGVPLLWQGSVRGDEALRLQYAAADVTVVPSREDNMPLTAMEAHSCGTSVVAFDIGGLPDIVSHHETGYLAEPFDTLSLATGLSQALGDAQHDRAWSRAARARSLATWSRERVVAQYLDLYAECGA